METERQIRELEKAMNTTDNRRLYERFLAVKLVLEGHRPHPERSRAHHRPRRAYCQPLCEKLLP